MRKLQQNGMGGYQEHGYQEQTGLTVNYTLIIKKIRRDYKDVLSSED